MGLDLSITINNEQVTGVSPPVRSTADAPVIKWTFDQVGRVTIDPYTGVPSTEAEYGQLGYEIRISTSSINIGQDAFIGNRIQTGFVNSQEKYWRYSGMPIERGEIYYGQIKVTDDAGRESTWHTFAFQCNSLPYVTGLSIEPLSPTPTDDLILTYIYGDDDEDLESGTKIRWFKNGVYQKQHDNASMVRSLYVQNGDIWNADVLPSDGYEYGIRVTSPHVQVKRAALVASNVRILPLSPNDNDVLKADYELNQGGVNEEVSYRWYINDALQTSLNDMQYVRPSVSEGDAVSVEVKTASMSAYVSSSDILVGASDFVVSNITIDGRTEPLDVSSITPLIKWKSFIPVGKTVNYVSIRVGTFYEASNVYSGVFSFDRDTFTIPPNTLQRGRDYYVSIALSDTQTFNKYYSSHFRVRGSRWEEGVDNATGWTMETLFVVKGATTEGDDYQVMRINDGSRFAEIRIYSTKVSLISTRNKEYDVDLVGSQMLTVVGQGDDIKVYLNRSLVIDGTGIFAQPSTTKRLELGCPTTKSFEVHYKYFFYTVSGAYHPGQSSQFSDLQFHTLYEFEANEVAALSSYKDGEKVFAVNPDNSNEGSSVYSIIAGPRRSYGTVTRTFSPIQNMASSPDGKLSVLAHAKGATVIQGYAIGTYNDDLLFIDAAGAVTNIYPDQVGWELVQTIGYNAAYFATDGLHINTTGTLE